MLVMVQTTTASTAAPTNPCAASPAATRAPRTSTRETTAATAPASKLTATTAAPAKSVCSKPSGSQSPTVEYSGDSSSNSNGDVYEVRNKPADGMWRRGFQAASTASTLARAAASTGPQTRPAQPRGSQFGPRQPVRPKAAGSAQNGGGNQSACLAFEQTFSLFIDRRRCSNIQMFKVSASKRRSYFTV